ncbi:MAG: alpha-L-fucosidase [Verrucomicrobiota bacterium]|nr:alpha-L-fucosidase [Verrucomicrobiota bacterium]
MKYEELRYGMFIHYGLFSMLGRGEWVMNREEIPVEEYAKLADKFDPSKFDADAICDFAVNNGMKYIVFTTMHHEGFRLYDTYLSDYNSVKSCGRDLTQEIVDAAKQRGLKIALYHSLNNWYDQPDAVDALEDEEKYQIFIKNTFARIKELVTKYNPIDVLWYDGWWPFNAEQWQAEKMNAMVREIQPHILFNGRNGLDGDFGTPEGHVSAPNPWRPWEACITLNNNWGYHRGDHNWKNQEELIDMLAKVAQGNGNLLLNIGPKGDGSIPEESVTIVEEVGRWIKKNSEALYNTEIFDFDLQERGNHRGDWSNIGSFTAKGNNLYFWIKHWVGQTLTIGGLESKVKKVFFLDGGEELKFQQKETKLVILGLPENPPDSLCTVLKIECETPPEIYLSGGMRTPQVEHPHYDPCPSDIQL